MVMHAAALMLLTVGLWATGTAYSARDMISQGRGSYVALADHKADALLVSSPASIRYLTGYAGSNGLVLITGSDAHFFTDPRYAIEAQQNIDCKVHVCRKPLIDEAAAISKRKRLKRLGFEPGWNAALDQLLALLRR